MQMQEPGLDWRYLRRANLGPPMRSGWAVSGETAMKNLFARFVREEDGQDIIEYALLAAFISIVAWLILQNIGQDVQQMYSNVQKATNGAAGAGS